MTGPDGRRPGSPRGACGPAAGRRPGGNPAPGCPSPIPYTNAPWTLKADTTSEYMCRLLNHMKRRGYKVATPRRAPSVAEKPFFGLTSGYVQRGIGLPPKQGSRRPWRMHRNHALDAVAFRFGPVADGTMQFARR